MGWFISMESPRRRILLLSSQHTEWIQLWAPVIFYACFFFQPIHMVISCTGRACSRTTLRSRHCQSKLPTGSLFRMHCRRQLESEERAIRLVDSMLLTTECFIDTFLLSWASDDTQPAWSVACSRGCFHVVWFMVIASCILSCAVCSERSCLCFGRQS